nr:nuclear factor 7, brain-like isoform X1 [Caretta caretta]
MASALDASSLAEDLLCPICLSLFRDPRMLECGHSFCAACLEPCVPKGQGRGLCPECRHPFALRRVATNWALCSLAEKARLLKLDEGAQPGGKGSGWSICLEHEEPLKLFCSQDEGPVCVICRDLPQHRGHDFLPIKNAVQKYQDKLKASLVPLKDNLNSVTEDQRRQQENIAELESYTQDLLGYITEEFEVLHQILQEKEQGMKETVGRLKEENREEMEERLKELDEEVTFRSETLSMARVGLDTSDHTAFLRGIKELMRRRISQATVRRRKRMVQVTKGPAAMKMIRLMKMKMWLMARRRKEMKMMLMARRRRRKMKMGISLLWTQLSRNSRNRWTLRPGRKCWGPSKQTQSMMDLSRGTDDHLGCICADDPSPQRFGFRGKAAIYFEGGDLVESEATRIQPL